MALHAVVVGGGVAATTCAEALLAHAALHGLRVRVTLVCQSPTVALARALVSSGRARELHVHSVDGVKWAVTTGSTFIRARCTRLDAASRTLNLSNDTSLHYDVVCLATGAAPVLPRQVQADDVYIVRDARSVRKLQAALKHARHVLVVGNGGVALEAIHALRNVQVTWVFRNQHPAAAFFDPIASAALLEAPDRARAAEHAVAAQAAAQAAADGAAHEPTGAAHGPFWEAVGVLKGALHNDVPLSTRPGCAIERVKRCDGKLEVSLSDRSLLRCDIIVCGTGIAPCVQWLVGSGIRLAKGPATAPGIVVQPDSMRASLPHVYAAGDCATVLQDASHIGRDWFQRCLWTQATSMGTAAGRAMTAELAQKELVTGMEFELFAHATRFFGVPVVFLGRYAAQHLPDGYTIMEDGGGGSKAGFARVVLYNGRMRGALLVGEATERAEAYENVILDELHVANLGHALVDLNEDISDYFD